MKHASEAKAFSTDQKVAAEMVELDREWIGMEGGHRPMNGGDALPAGFTQADESRVNAVEALIAADALCCAKPSKNRKHCRHWFRHHVERPVLGLSDQHQ